MNVYFVYITAIAALLHDAVSSANGRFGRYWHEYRGALAFVILMLGFRERIQAALASRADNNAR